MKISKIVLLFVFLLTFNHLPAQGPPDPPGGGHGQQGDIPPGGGAPINGGIEILISLGAVYAGKKLYNLQNQKTCEMMTT
jgi:hypothetical protein